MEVKVLIPSMGLKEAHGSIGVWFKKKGDRVKRGEALCTVETEKASVEIESPCSGILKEILYLPDAEVNIGDCVAIIENNEKIYSE